MGAFGNVYDDETRAAAYATLEYPGTYYLAFRDLPGLIKDHVHGGARDALDFGCGTGRSTRYLEQLGFRATGVDISDSMLRRARERDPDGRYLLIEDGDFSPLEAGRFDVILSAFAFDNIPGVEKRNALLRGLSALLRPDGRIFLLGSTPDIYMHEWASFTTRDFPENRSARSGDPVRIVMKDVPDSRPVVDLIWFPEDYEASFRQAGLRMITHHKPLGRPGDGQPWVSETRIAPWIIYVLARGVSSSALG